MPMLVRRRGPIMNARPQRSRMWLGQTQVHNYAGAPGTPDAQDSLLFTQVSIEQMDRPTIVRLRGMWNPLITAAGASSTPVFFWVGIGVQNEKAVTMGAGALPCPYTDGDWNGWLYMVQAIVNTANPTVLNMSANPVSVIDGQGQRRIGEDDLLFGSCELVGRPADTDMNVAISLRCLFLDNG